MSMMPVQVPEDVKADRLQRVMRLGCAHALERSQRYMGREEEVLVEERNPKNASQVRPGAVLVVRAGWPVCARVRASPARLRMKFLWDCSSEL